MTVIRNPIGLKPSFVENGTMQGLPITIVGGDASSEKREINPVAIPSTEADVWDPGLAATVYLDVEFELVNIDGTNDATASIGVDIDGDGSGTPDWYFCKSVPVRAGEPGVRIGPYRIRGDDHITGDANAASDVIMHIYIVGEGTAK